MDEGVRLLSECRVKNSTEGSNPSLSANPSFHLVRGIDSKRAISLPDFISRAPVPIGPAGGTGIMKKRSGMTKKEIIRTLILSPCYLNLKLKERARLIQRLIRKPRA